MRLNFTFLVRALAVVALLVSIFTVVRNTENLKNVQCRHIIVVNQHSLVVPEPDLVFYVDMTDLLRCQSLAEDYDMFLDSIVERSSVQVPVVTDVRPFYVYMDGGYIPAVLSHEGVGPVKRHWYVMLPTTFSPIKEIRRGKCGQDPLIGYEAGTALIYRCKYNQER